MKRLEGSHKATSNIDGGFGLLTVIIIGFLLIPVMILLSFVPFVHMAYAAYKVNQGVDYRYPFVADLVGGSRRIG